MQTLDRINKIKNWINSYCKSMPNEASSLVIGISGGIDSSVTSTLCALTGKKTIIISMPIKQIKKQHALSLKHQENIMIHQHILCGYETEHDNLTEDM